MDDNKSKALQAALAQIEKQFGKGSIMKMGEGLATDDIQTVSTGSLGLDIALGIGGLPRGRVVEIYGPESSGKTPACMRRGSPEGRRHRCLHRRRKRTRPGLRRQTRRECPGPTDFATRYGRAGARNH
jgi:hypothetical protein